MSERQARLLALQQKREAAHQDNLELAKEEQFRKEVNPKEEAKKARQRKKWQKIGERLEAEEKGLDYERQQGLKYSLAEVEAWEKKQKAKEKNKDPGFSDFHTLSHRKYKKRIRELKPDLAAYDLAKQEALASGQSTFKDRNALDFIHHRATPEKAEQVAADIEHQRELRANFSKRRAFRDDQDITFINERNYRFNKKIGRAYDVYTEDLKESLERGTAL